MAIDTDTGAAAGADDSGGEQEQRRPAPTGLTRDDFHAKERAAFLAGAEADGEGDAEETRAKPVAAKPAKVIGAPVDDDDDDEPALEVEVDAAADDDDEGVVEPDADEPEPDDEDAADDEVAAKDPALAKRMAVMRRTEQRQREAFTRERTAFEQERAGWQTERRQLTASKQRFDELSARAKYDSYSVLRLLGVPDDDMEVHAQHLYSRSKAATVKPEHRAAADREMRLREAADEAKRATAETAELKQTLEQRDQQAANAREAEAYLGRVVRKVDDATPLTKALVAKNPTKARDALMKTTLDLVKKLGGQLPKAAQVAAAHEKKLVRELRDLGIGIEPPAGSTPAKGAPAIKAKPGTAAVVAAKAKPAARVNGAVVIPSRSEMVAELEGLTE